MTAKRHTVTGGILLAAAALSLAPTLRAISVFGFDASQLSLLACSLAIAGGGLAELATAAAKDWKKEKNRDKHRANPKRIPSRNCGSAEGPENLIFNNFL